MKSKGHLYIYTHQVFSKIKSIFLLTNKSFIQHIEGGLQSPGTSIVIEFNKARKIIQGDKVLSGIVGIIDYDFSLCIIDCKFLVKNLHIKIRQVILHQHHGVGHRRRDYR
jgi:hypothetical protein